MVWKLSHYAFIIGFFRYFGVLGVALSLLFSPWSPKCGDRRKRDLRIRTGAKNLVNRSKNRHHDARLDQAIHFAMENIAETISLMDLACVAKMSRFCFCRRFHLSYGKTPMRWFWEIRTILAMEMIVSYPSRSLTDVAFACGFGSSAHFSRAFRTQFGLSPRDLRELAMASDFTAVRTGVPTEWTW